MPQRPGAAPRCACVKHFGASECLIIKNLHLILVCFFLFGHISFYECECVRECVSVCVWLMVIASSSSVRRSVLLMLYKYQILTYLLAHCLSGQGTCGGKDGRGQGAVAFMWPKIWFACAGILHSSEFQPSWPLVYLLINARHCNNNNKNNNVNNRIIYNYKRSKRNSTKRKSREVKDDGGESKLSKSRRTFFIFMPLCGHNNDKDDLMPLKQQNAVKAKETIYKADRGTLSGGWSQ